MTIPRKEREKGGNPAGKGKGFRPRKRQLPRGKALWKKKKGKRADSGEESWMP